MASKEVRAALTKPFPADEVKQREGPGGRKLDYISGDQVIRRLQEATADQDLGYAWTIGFVKVEKEGNRYRAEVMGTLQIGGDAGAGVGSKTDGDADMALKSANTEALKNAAKNGFGVGLELWDKEYLATLNSKRRVMGGDNAAMKQAVWKIAKARLGGDKNPSVAQVAKLFGVTTAGLQEDNVLKSILEEEGVL